MLVGHFGIAQLGKAIRREIPFAWLVVAVYLPDLVRVPLTALTKYHEIWSHSIPAVSGLALVAAVLYLVRGGRVLAAAVIAVACLSHWPADYFTGCKPTTFNGPWFGLISYRRPISDLLVECGLLIVGWVAARRTGFAISRTWLAIGIAVQVGFLASMYAGAQFVIGDHEWTWRPSVSLAPQPQALEALVCKPPTY
jgi:hypothetical protein